MHIKNKYHINYISFQMKICLNMIVKNESRIIQRLLDSVLPYIDCYCICDTGSTDNTIEIIEKLPIPGKIIREPFRDFGYNRTFALKACEEIDADYILLLDADMILKTSNDFDKKTLWKADSFSILQGSDDFYYNNLRIIKNNGLYKYIGVTHEYISRPENEKTRQLSKNELFIIDIGDGGSK